MANPSETRSSLPPVASAAAAPSPASLLLHAPVVARAERTPDAVALSDGGGAVTYGELDRWSDRLAHHLRALGVGPEARVGVLLERSPEAVGAVVAVLKAGGAYVPLDLSAPDPRLAVLVAESGAAAVVTTAALARRLPPGLATVRLDADAAAIARRRATPLAAAARPGNLAYVLFTSGSTGRPKAVAMGHGAIAGHLRWVAAALPLTPADVVLHKTVLGFDPSINELFAPLAAGARVAVAPEGAERDAAELARLLRREGVTVAELVPAQLRLLVDEPEFGRCTALGRVQCGGEALAPDLLARFHRVAGAELINLYGPTEAAVEVTSWRAERGVAEVPIGRPVADIDARVVDRALEPVAEGETGELAVGGASLARGYLGRPGLTAERFVPSPAGPPGARLYRTGDLVRRRADGELVCLGRLDLQLKVRGFRIEPGEVEAALRRHPAVAQAVVTAAEAAPGDRRLVAYLVAARGVVAPAVEELRRFVAAELPAPMVPAAFVVLPELPLLPSGKVDRRALPAPELSRGGLATPYAPPRSPRERELAGLFAEHLAVEEVGRDDDFFALGGHSLVAVRLLGRLRDRHGVELSMRELFAAPTVAALAARLAAEGEGGDADSRLPAIRPRTGDGPPPVAPAQERVLFLEQLEPASLAYQFQEVIVFSGDLDAGALAAGLADVCRRHEIYRTSFAFVDGRWRQVVHPPAAVPLPRVDLTALPDRRAGSEARRGIAAQVATRFDVGRLPLVRWTLYRVAPRRHRLLHHEHHLIHDGWAFNLFLAELLATYRALARGLPPPLPEPAVQFGDFAVVEEEWLAGDGAARQLAYWVDRLAGSPSLDLPTDRPRPPRQTFGGATRVVALPASLVDPLRALGRGEGATLYMTCCALFVALLHRYTGERDLCVGTAVGNRRWPGAEGLFGMLVNNVVLRSSLAGDPSFRALVGRVRGAALGAWDRQELPFDRVVQALKPERDPGRNPLFQVMFSFHDSALPDLHLPALEVGLDEATFNASAKFDLAVIGMPRFEQHLERRDAAATGEVVLLWEYNSDLFDAATVERMVRHYRALAESAGASPERAVGTLPMLGRGERRQLLAEWNDSAAAESGAATLHGRFALQAARTPAAVAVRGDGGTLTYRELAARAAALARRLRAAGVGPEARVGLCAGRSPELVTAMLAILEAGAAYLPLDPGLPAERLALLLADSRAAAAVADAAGAAALRGTPVPVIAVDGGAADEAPPAAAPAVHPDHPAYVLYTSGSTGRPKGVVVSHRAIVNHMRWMAAAFPLGADDRVLQKTPASFDASVWEFHAPLAAGAELVLAAPGGHEDPAYLVAAVRRHRITVLQVVPTMLAALAEEPGWEECASLRLLFCGGEVLPGALVERVGRRLPVPIVNLYGPTEAAIDATFGLAAATPRGVAAVGRPIANLRAYVAHPATLEPAPVGVAGELLLAGDGLARGYLDRPARTAERFIPDPLDGGPGGRLYRTGDLARRLAGGELEVAGRLDDQVKLRGFRIELGEVEAALGAHPEVAECAAAVCADGAGERRLVAYLVAAPGRPPAIEGLRERLRRRLPDYMVPSRFVVLPALPRTAGGKLDRRALPAPDGTAPPAAEFVAPRTEVERLLAGIWSELIGVERVGVRDNFFDLGGHSLHAARHAHRVRALLGVDLPLRAVFEAPTVERLAAVVEELLVAELAAEAAAGAPTAAAGEGSR